MFFILLLYGHVVLAGKRLLYFHSYPRKTYSSSEAYAEVLWVFNMFPSMVFPPVPYPVDSIMSAFWSQVICQRPLRSRNRKHLGFLLDQAVMSEPLKPSHRMTAGWLHLCLTDITPVNTKYLTVSLVLFWYLSSKNVHGFYLQECSPLFRYWAVVLCVFL